MKVSADLFDSNIGFENSLYQLVLQPDLEDAKGLEIHNSLKAIQAKLDQTYAFLTKEGEFAHETIEATASVNAAREISALQEANYKLHNQVEELQKRFKTELEEAKGEDIMKLQNSLQAMQTKVDETNALLIKERESAQKAIEKASIIVRETGEIHVKDMEKIEKLSAEVEELKKLLEAERNRANESEKKCIDALERLEEKPTNINSKNKVLRQQALAMAQFTKLQKQQEYQELLNRCITQQPRFSKGLPIAACQIYRCLRQGRAFEGEKTSIFDLIIQTIGQAIEAQEKNNNVLAYWLSTASILLVVLQQTLRQDEANSPVILFKQQLTAYVEKIYGMIRDNLKGEILPLIELCTQAPKLSTVHFLLMERDERDVSLWQEIVNKMDSFLNLLKSNHVSPFLVRKIFMQTFYFINGQLFNCVLLRRECCTFNNGEYFKAGLSKMEHWCYKATEEYAGSAWDELKHTRQAIGFLVIHQKDKKTLDEISHDLCPLISIPQLHRISTAFLDDKYGTYSLSPDVISKMEVLMTEDSDHERSIPPLLINDTSQPLSFDGLFESMDQINIEDVEPPPLICDNLGFGFLPRDES